MSSPQGMLEVLIINTSECDPTWREGLYRSAQLLQSCPTLCNPMECSPPGSSVLGILQASILEWVDISFGNLLTEIVNSK